IVQQLGHVPDVGESAGFDGHTLTVTELDGRRIARIRVVAASTGSGATAAAPGTASSSEAAATDPPAS
ncbi:MAG: hypothetical protein H0U61_00540, partial [Nocardioidaceae bacterium]|nr:hypothetical protein [Nocardioidaceae bacterium]